MLSSNKVINLRGKVMFSSSKVLEYLSRIEAEFFWYTTVWDTFSLDKEQPMFKFRQGQYCVVYNVKGEFVKIVNWGDGERHIDDEKLASELLLAKHNEIEDQRKKDLATLYRGYAV